MAELPLPSMSQRMIAIGDTGSGKTYLLERMAAYYPEVQYIDLKNEFEPQVPHRVSKDLRQAWKLRGHVLVRPSLKQDHRDWYEWYLMQLLQKRKDVVILVDEVYLLGGMNHTSYPPALAKLEVIGRSKRLPVWSGIQRPKFAPTVIFAQSEHWNVFPLSETDLDVLKGWIPTEAIDAIRRLRYDHGFVHIHKEQGGRKVFQTYAPLVV